MCNGSESYLTQCVSDVATPQCQAQFGTAGVRCIEGKPDSYHRNVCQFYNWSIFDRQSLFHAQVMEKSA